MLCDTDLTYTISVIRAFTGPHMMNKPKNNEKNCKYRLCIFFSILPIMLMASSYLPILRALNAYF